MLSMNQIVKKTLNVVIDVIVAVLVVFAVLISISTITASSNNNIPNLFGYSPFSVQTESMEPTFGPGDYIFVKACDDATTLEKGDIISFLSLVDGQKIINTHRIVDVVTTDNSVLYQTKGDNATEPDESLVAPSDVIGEFTGKYIPGFGNVMDFLSSRWGFFGVVLIPILLFTIYQIYRLIATIQYNKKVELANEVADSTSDDVKEAIIAEYLEKQKAQEQEQQDKTSE